LRTEEKGVSPFSSVLNPVDDHIEKFNVRLIIIR